MAKTVKLHGEEFDIVPPKAVAASAALADLHKQLGRPEDPYSKQGEQMMRYIVAAWEDLYPQEARKWIEDRKEYKTNELSARQQVKQHTGRSLASIPFPVYQMMGKIFPNFKMRQRDDYIKFVKKYPIFRMTETGV